MKTCFALLFCAILFIGNARAEDIAAPKKLLVVTVTTGFRHSSIPTAKKILQQLADRSKAFTLDFVDQPAGQPAAPKKPAALKPGATPDQQAAFQAAMDKYQAGLPGYQEALAAWTPSVAKALEKLSPANLKNYDGVIFANTTGDLPLPDREGFLAWLKAGHAFIGIHSASDTLHPWPGYWQMLGGEFETHHAQVGVQCLNEDPSHPANKSLGPTWDIAKEEIYRFKNYDQGKVHELLALDKDPNTGVPGHFPISWCRDYGSGRVFYTALGHREDLWDADPAIKDRQNPVAAAEAYQAHLLGGILWALAVKAPN